MWVINFAMELLLSNVVGKFYIDVQFINAVPLAHLNLPRIHTFATVANYFSLLCVTPGRVADWPSLRYVPSSCRVT